MPEMTPQQKADAIRDTRAAAKALLATGARKVTVTMETRHADGTLTTDATAEASR